MLSKRKCLKNEAQHLAVARKFDSDLDDIWSFSTLFWTEHLSIILKFVFHIYMEGGDPCKTGVKKSRLNVVPRFLAKYA